MGIARRARALLRDVRTQQIPSLADYLILMGTLLIWASLTNEQVGRFGLLAGLPALAVGFAIAARSRVLHGAVAQWLPLAFGFAVMGLLQTRGVPLFWEGVALWLVAYTCFFAAFKAARRLLRMG